MTFSIIGNTNLQCSYTLCDYLFDVGWKIAINNQMNSKNPYIFVLSAFPTLTL